MISIKCGEILTQEKIKEINMLFHQEVAKAKELGIENTKKAIEEILNEYGVWAPSVNSSVLNRTQFNGLLINKLNALN